MAANYKYTPDAIYTATNGGLNYIHKVYPQSIGFEGKNKGFKIREEKTASTRLKEINGVWFVTDFGDEMKGKNAIEICMDQEGLTFPDALKFLYGEFGINGEKSQKKGADWKQENTNEPKEHFHVECLDEVTNLDVFAPFLIIFRCLGH